MQLQYCLMLCFCGLWLAWTLRLERCDWNHRGCVGVAYGWAAFVACLEVGVWQLRMMGWASVLHECACVRGWVRLTDVCDRDVGCVWLGGFVDCVIDVCEYVWLSGTCSLCGCWCVSTAYDKMSQCVVWLCGRTWVCKTEWCVCYGCGLRMARRHLQPVWMTDVSMCA